MNMKHFIDEEIQVELADGEFLEKSPKCPTRVFWRNGWIHVDELLSAWDDVSRKGKFARNMREENLQRAKIKGSWGVGKFYFMFLGDDGIKYTIYYDRAPGNANDRKGKWILLTSED
jgi:hypothetical protein